VELGGTGLWPVVLGVPPETGLQHSFSATPNEPRGRLYAIRRDAGLNRPGAGVTH